MASSFSSSVSAVQVGTYFVGQYYEVLRKQPELAHHFYTDDSTMIRVDGSASETANAMLQIHSLIMSLNLAEIEVKTLHSLDSWNSGVLVMVSGSVQTKGSNTKRRFMQTFFLAPQEKGYFVLNDIFHFFDDEQIHQHPGNNLTLENFGSELNATNPLPEPDYTLGGETQSREFVDSTPVEENDMVDKYSIPEPPPQAAEVDEVVEETPAEESYVSYPPLMDAVQEPLHVPVEEPAEEPPKQTYASILRDAKGQSRPPVAHQAYVNRTAPPAASDWPLASQTTQQSRPSSSIVPERSNVEAAEEITTLEEEGEGRSVFVRNLPSTVSASDIEREFKNFGRIKSEGVVVRNRKDIGVCYAFVEFEDASSVQNAIKESPIQLGGRQVHIEERRAGSSSSRGGRRGRGRGSYQSEGLRGRFGAQTSGRGGNQDVGDRDYSNDRTRGNGFHQRGPRQERGVLGNQGWE
eukprot:TRINITY_DN1294_c0_g1_i1.p1 TRINITY_DN1294_c0_g1~~TRINITY_DN1294_c0_g1_i1.p1  ORF type:complete len:464 (-),score=116.70 TRINITY_DN1294_c0_g1_i1:337-1728(-)